MLECCMESLRIKVVEYTQLDKTLPHTGTSVDQDSDLQSYSTLVTSTFDSA